MLKLRENKIKLEKQLSQLLLKFHLDNNLISDEHVSIVVNYQYFQNEENDINILQDVNVYCDIIL